MLKRCLLVCSLLTAFAPLVCGSRYGDPTIVIDSGDPDPLSLANDLLQVQPDGTTPLTFDFINDTGGIVTQLMFQTTINAGLSTGDAASFTPCSSSYFPFCTVTYDSSTGVLVYDAYTLPVFITDSPTQAAGPQYGIPVNAAFHITLDGWITNATSSGGVLLYSGLPTLDNSFTDDFENFAASPEPASLLLAGTALILGACLMRRRSKTAG
ncbi:MAG TPA: hypothetical protein VMH28_09050 [Candidatus Acidoferrales bacterium]|nr:hypothetical protein [Candidatus Acidoferrales bacterium]